MTPELQNYITQSRASGMSDDQIKQNLLSQGWSEADIAQALGSDVAVSPAGNNQGASKRKLIAIVLVLLLIVGAGAWFLISKSSEKNQDKVNDNKTNTNSNSNTITTTPPAQKEKASFACKDIFTPADFKSVIGEDVGEYKLKETDDFGMLSCMYYQEDSTNVIGIKPGKGTSHTVVYKAPSNYKDVKDMYYAGKQLYVTEYPKAATVPKEFVGIGTDAYDAYYAAKTVHVLSTNQKYEILLGTDSLAEAAKFAKIINEHLNNY